MQGPRDSESCFDLHRWQKMVRHNESKLRTEDNRRSKLTKSRLTLFSALLNHFAAFKKKKNFFFLIYDIVMNQTMLMQTRCCQQVDRRGGVASRETRMALF